MPCTGMSGIKATGNGCPERIDMKKPVKKTKVQIEAMADKQKKQQVTITKSIKSGNLENIIGQAEQFASDNDVATEDIKLSVTGYFRYMWFKRPETRKEHIARLTKKWRNEYMWLKSQYDMEQRQKANQTYTCICTGCPGKNN